MDKESYKILCKKWRFWQPGPGSDTCVTCVYTSIHASHLARPGQRLCRQRPAARQPRLRRGAVARCTCHFQDLVGIGLPLARLQQPFQPSSVLTLGLSLFFLFFFMWKVLFRTTDPINYRRCFDLNWGTARNSEGLFPIMVFIPKGFFPTCPKGFIPKFSFYFERVIILKIFISTEASFRRF